VKLNLIISGMSCEHCTNYVKQVLGEMDGITVIDVNLEGAVIENSGSASEAEIKAVIDEAGYELTKIQPA